MDTLSILEPMNYKVETNRRLTYSLTEDVSNIESVILIRVEPQQKKKNHTIYNFNIVDYLQSYSDSIKSIDSNTLKKSISLASDYSLIYKREKNEIDGRFLNFPNNQSTLGTSLEDSGNEVKLHLNEMNSEQFYLQLAKKIIFRIPTAVLKDGSQWEDRDLIETSSGSIFYNSLYKVVRLTDQTAFISSNATFDGQYSDSYGQLCSMNGFKHAEFLIDLTKMMLLKGEGKLESKISAEGTRMVLSITEEERFSLDD